uniref:hypothetical protein n=1 Tax=Amphritea sp. TaxID=1872502 RepID=UPI003D11557A
MKESSRDFLIISIGKATHVLLMLASLKLVTYYLAPSVMGQIYLFTTVYTFFVYFLVSPVGQYFNRYTHKWESQSVLYHRFLLYLFYMIFVSILSSLGAVLVYLVDDALDVSLLFFSLLTGGFVLIVSANQIIVHLFNMLNYRLFFSMLTFMTSFLALCFSLGFIFVVDRTATSWLQGILIGNAVVLVVAFFIMRRILLANEKRFNILLDFGFLNR